MAFRAALNAAFTASGTALSTYIDSMEFSRDIDTAETTTFGVSGNAKTYIVTLNGATLSMSGHWDPGSSGPDVLINNIISAGTAITNVAYPGGTATGQRSYTFSGFPTNYTASSDVGDDTKWSAEWIVTGAVTVATL